MINFALWTLVCVTIVVVSYKLSRKPKIVRFSFMGIALAFLYVYAPVAFVVMAVLCVIATVLQIIDLASKEAKHA